MSPAQAWFLAGVLVTVFLGGLLVAYFQRPPEPPEPPMRTKNGRPVRTNRDDWMYEDGPDDQA